MLMDCGSQRWFAIDSKSFKFSSEEDGRKKNVFIIERSMGRVSWIRFGEESLKILLKGVETYRRDAVSKKKFL